SLPVYPERLGLRLLNQDLGYWNVPKISGPLKIWVAGCGTNQAIFTALRFPECTVLATDVSTGSLEVARGTAAQIGIKNLTIVELSINSVDFENEFDYIICTGVIHHNADPAYTLSKLVRALKTNGVMELMVYNYYQRLLTTAFQKAVRVLTRDSMDFVNEYRVAKTILTEQNSSTAMNQFVY
ncbi:MAG: class I SAM-dependent methyltransferase, partial [Flammeovirgaceae bacterium]